MVSTLQTKSDKGMVNPHIVSIETTEIVLGWNITQDGVGLFDRCTAYVNGSQSVEIGTEPPVVLTGLQPGSEYFFYIICSNSLGVSSRIDFPVVTTRNTVPARPPVLSEAAGSVGQYSFKVNVPHYNESNEPISCFEFIVVQLYNSSTNIDSEDGAFSTDGTRDYNISKNQTGTPFRAMVFSSLPANETITIGSLTEVETECFIGNEQNDDERVRRGTVKASTLRAINGPLNPGGYYTCFLRVYSPTGQDGEFYYVNGPAMNPVKLRDADSQEEMTLTNTTTLITALPIIIIIVLTIIISVSLYIYKRRRSERADNVPVALSRRQPQKMDNKLSEDGNRYSLKRESEQIFENFHFRYQQDEYETVEVKKDVVKPSEIEDAIYVNW